MAKRKRSKKRPQPRRKNKQQESQHDRRKRLQTENPQRVCTTTAKFPLAPHVLAWITPLLNAMDQRIGWRLPILMAGMLLAEGRRTASRWFVAAAVRDDWDHFYDLLISLARS